MFGLDDPDHGRLKRLITPTFTRGRIENMIPVIEQICARLLDEADLRSSLRALAEYPGQLRALREDPALLANLPDEALRYYSTTQYNLREAARPIELHGVTIPQGANVILLRGAANRDERQFTDPDTFDLRRANSAAHLGFGEGAIICTGAALTRAEVRVAFSELLSRLGEFEITSWDRKPMALFWGPSSADIQYTSSK